MKGRKAYADWDRISSLMSRRGPDDHGSWSDKRHCTVAFRRLAIIDLSLRGHQPMTAIGDRYALVFNGEVYNFMYLRRQLESRGIEFSSNSDTEAVLYSLIEWGSGALARFNGMFALGFYDRVEKKLLLARDHAGIKPLYYLVCSDGIVFGSQYDQLLEHPWGRYLRVSEKALGLYLRLAYVPAPYALMENTHMLEPGTWMEVTAEGDISRGRFFDLPHYAAPTLRGEEAIEAVDEAVTAAVRRHLVSDVPVGAFLSGGIDSPLVVAKMRSLSNSPIRAFTIGTGERTTDESEDAVNYAREIGVEHRVRHISAGQAIDLIDDVIEACGEPFGDYSIFPTLMVSRLASRDHKVVLSGDGGDELFWGYPGRFSRLISLAGAFRTPPWMRKVRWAMNKALSGGSGNGHLRMKSLGDWHRSMHNHLPEAVLREIFPSLPVWPPECGAFSYGGCDPDRAAQHSRWNEFVYHLTMVLLKVDRASMYNSLEVRVPLLDRQVIEVASQIDWNDCLNIELKTGKLPLRRALARYVNYQTQGKRGFEIPMATWLRTSLKGLFEEKVLSRSDFLGLELDRKALKKIFERHVSGERDYAWGLWPLLSLSLWIERHRSPYSAGHAGHEK
ncbi:MAG: asparagine synthase (glutamine-hydrolyzing) [Nitrospirae bacterium]|nr:asparagine synthase (glutamine-hydrolyzing) [Nitrospirota bacterium]